jgi:DAK2 domain fusion protein YloV
MDSTMGSRGLTRIPRRACSKAGGVDVVALDGRAFAKFLIAGTYFVKKYRAVLNDLNVFPVPDGDTGTNMYLTLRSAVTEAGKLPAGRRTPRPLSEVAAAAAEGSLMGARGNSGVILSQMLRGFAHHVRHRGEIDTFMLATAMREAVAAARGALLKPVDGTIISVAEAAAESAYHLALHERDLYRLATGVLRAANDALERTPDQLPVLEEAGVVDAGGAGFVYFFEGILRFLPDTRVRATAFPRRPVRRSAFTPAQIVGENKYCAEFVLEDARCSAHELLDLLASRGESLLVIGAPPTIKVHVHTGAPERITEIAARYGRVTRTKVDDMEQQHRVLVIDAPVPEHSVVAVVPGSGFERIARELGAEVTVVSSANPSVRDLVLAVNKTLGKDVYLFANDKNVVLAANEAAALAEKCVHVVPTVDAAQGIAGLFAFRAASNGHAPSAEELLAAASRVRTAQLYIAGKDAVLGGVIVARGKPAASFDGALFTDENVAEVAAAVLRAMGAESGGLVTLYYGGAQKEKDAARLSLELTDGFPGVEVEYYYGGMKNAEFWVSYER